jgi:hypothetical protein
MPMNPFLVAVVFGGLLLTLGDVELTEKTVQPPGPLMYQANKDGGYDFFRDGRRLAYSRAGNDWTSQTLFVVASRVPRRDKVVLELTTKHAGWHFVRNNPLGRDINAIETALRMKPDLSAEPAEVPMIAGSVPPLPHDFRYFANKSGGYTFTRNGTVIFYSQADPLRGQTLYQPGSAVQKGDVAIARVDKDGKQSILNGGGGRQTAAILEAYIFPILKNPPHSVPRP